MAIIKNHNTQENKIKLEDLLRLKKMEKPDESFWNHFEIELKQKRLRTLLKKEPLPLRWAKSIYKRLIIITPISLLATFTFICALNNLRPLENPMKQGKEIINAKTLPFTFSQKTLLSSDRNYTQTDLSIPNRSYIHYSLGSIPSTRAQPLTF